jgi:hypothetical protein
MIWEPAATFRPAHQDVRKPKTTRRHFPAAAPPLADFAQCPPGPPEGALAPTSPGWRFQIIVATILISIGVLLYGRTLGFPFAFDDHLYLLSSPLVKEARSFVFHGDILAFARYSESIGLYRDVSTNFILRPVSYFTFYLNYLAHGMRPEGFRTVNIAIHCINAFLVFLLLSRLLRATPRPGLPPAKAMWFIPLASALLFLAHPLQTESVTYIVQRFTSLGTMFYLSTVLAHCVSVQSPDVPASRYWRCVSVAALVLGMLSKEIVFTAPFMVVAVDWLMLRTPLWSALKRARFHFLCMPIIPLLVMLISFGQNQGSLNVMTAMRIADPAGPPDYQYRYILTQLSVALEYLRLIVFPRGLNIDRDHPLATTILDPSVLVSGLLIAGIITGAWMWHRRRPDDTRARLLLCMVVWYFAGLVVSSSVIPLPDLMAEHRCYLSAVGTLAALVCCADILRTSRGAGRVIGYAVPILTLAWVIALGMATLRRNEVWRTEIGLWKDSVSKSPMKARPWFNLGGKCYAQGKLEETEVCMRRVVSLKPDDFKACSNLAGTLIQLGRPREALEAAEAGLKYAPRYHELHYSVGLAYSRLRNTAKSIEALNRAIAIRPNHRPAHLLLAYMYLRQNQEELALAHFEKAASLGALEPQHMTLAKHVEEILEQRRKGQ